MGDWQDEHKKRVAQFPEGVREAHRHSSHHRALVLESAICGCFHCCAMFASVEILEWVDEGDEGLGQTALCPRCGVDSVIPTGAGFELSPELLLKMKAHWF